MQSHIKLNAYTNIATFSILAKANYYHLIWKYSQMFDFRRMSPKTEFY